jgi:hypothetical protein
MAAAWIVNLYRNCSGGKEGRGCDVIDRKEARRGERKKGKSMMVVARVADR